MKKHHPHKEIDVEIDEEERELFLNAVYQNIIITPKNNEDKPPPPSKESPLSQSEQELFLRAAQGLDFYAATPPFEVKKTETKKKPKPSGIDASIDLHGLYSDEATARLLRFINREKNRGSRVLLVVHGKGAGVLKNAVWAVVESHPFVDDFQVAPGKYGGQGAIMVRINRKYK